MVYTVRRSIGDIQSIVDTIISKNSPTTTGSYSTRLKVGDNFKSLLFWSNPILLGATVAIAKIRMTIPTSATTAELNAWKSSVVSVQLAAKSWSVVTASWNNQPGVIGAPVNITLPAQIVAGQKIDLDIAPLMQALANNQKWYGLVISSPGLDRGFVSMNALFSERPGVTLDWSLPPSTPTGLSPSGSNYISVARPILSFDYTTGPGYDDLAAIQVQIFTSPNDIPGSMLHDSGWTNTSVSQYDLNAVNFSLTENQVVYWRVRIRDDDGTESAYSVISSFAFRNLNALVVTSPDQTASNPFVEDDTFPVSWTFADQVSFEVIVHKLDASGQIDESFTSGKITSPSQNYTIPAGVLDSVDSNYRVEVSVWDSYRRQQISYFGGMALGFANKKVNFIYKRTNTVTPVSSIDAQKGAFEFDIEVLVVRGSDPDSFTLVRNGVIVRSDIVPSSVRDPNNANLFRIKDIPPGRADVTWSVICVVNGRGSLTNPQITKRVRRKVDWICDEDGGHPVALVNSSQSLESGDVSTVIETLSARPFLITQQIGNERGTVDGELSSSSVDGLTSKQMKDNLDYIRRERGGVCRYIFSDESWTAFIFNISYRRINTADGLTDYAVSFGIYQVGNS